MVSLSVENTENAFEAKNNGILCLFFWPDFLDMMIERKVLQCGVLREDEGDNDIRDSDDLYVSAKQIRIIEQCDLVQKRRPFGEEN